MKWYAAFPEFNLLYCLCAISAGLGDSWPGCMWKAVQ